MYGSLQEEVKRSIYESKKGGKWTVWKEDVNENRKLFWREVSNAKRGKVKSCSRIKDGNGRMTLVAFEVWRIWEEYFEDLYNIDTQEQVVVYMCLCWGSGRELFWRKPIRRTEVEVRVGKLKNGKSAIKDEVTGEDKRWRWKGGYLILPLRVVLYLKTAGLLWLFHCTRVKERTECRDYRGISLSRVVGKLYAGILVESP